MNYEVDYAYELPQFEVLNVDADDAEDAEFKAMVILKELHPDATRINIEMIKKIK